MKLYMLIIKLEDETFTTFSDDYATIAQSKMDAECGMGAYCELYKRQHDDDFEQDSYQLAEI